MMSSLSKGRASSLQCTVVFLLGLAIVVMCRLLVIQDFLSKPKLVSLHMSVKIASVNAFLNVGLNWIIGYHQSLILY